MTILRIHHAQIPIPTGGEDRARAFYCDLLGLEELPKPDPLRARGGLWLRVGDGEVHLGVEAGWSGASQRAHVAYQVSDLDAWRSRLARAGLRLEAGAPVPGLARFELRDPFGNRVELVERTG